MLDGSTVDFGGAGCGVVANFEGTWFGGVFAYKPHTFEAFEVGVNGGGGSQADCGANLAHRWWVALGLDVLVYELEYLALAAAEFGFAHEDPFLGS